MMTLTTPALLFPAISLLLLAYTNKFLSLANLVRNLHKSYREEPNKNIFGQIENLQRRIIIIRNMQALGVSSFSLCVISMFLLFIEYTFLGEIVFGLSLVLLLISLVLSLWEIQISVHALSLQLSDMSSNREQ